VYLADKKPKLRYTGSQELHRKAFSISGAVGQEGESDCIAALRHRACDTLLPAGSTVGSYVEGYVGRNSETEPASSLGRIRALGISVTVDCILSECSDRRTAWEQSLHEALQCPHLFACPGFSGTCPGFWEYALGARFFQCALTGFGRFSSRALDFEGATLRSFSAYVPSARQAGAHAHPL
jgi:hypothetical protein